MKLRSNLMTNLCRNPGNSKGFTHFSCHCSSTVISKYYLSQYWITELDHSFILSKITAPIVTTPITSLFVVSSEIPKDWKDAVIALFKGGDTLDPNSYRPISILPCLSKVFESQVNKQTISNPTVPSPLCNLVSELVMGAPQPRSRS